VNSPINRATCLTFRSVISPGVSTLLHPVLSHDEPPATLPPPAPPQTRTTVTRRHDEGLQAYPVSPSPPRSPDRVPMTAHDQRCMHQLLERALATPKQAAVNPPPTATRQSRHRTSLPAWQGH
jgi:hypothetical protein